MTQKNVLITGAGSWIGRGIALKLAKNNYTCHLIGRHLNTLDETKALIEGMGGFAVCHQGDVSSLDDMNTITARLSTIDALVANAGIYPMSSIENMSMTEWQDVIDINLTGAFISLKACLPKLKQAKQGRIVFIGSIAGKVAVSNLAHYCASKSGLTGLARAAAVELAEYGITANVISPGNILNQERFSVSSDELKKMLDDIPAGRTGTPEDIAGMCNYLLGPDAGFITGQDFVIDGGETSL